MTIAYNKVTREWKSTSTPEELDSNWIIDPVFEDKEFANEIGQEYWSFDGNIIKTPTREEYAAIQKENNQKEMWRQIQAFRDERVSTGGVFVAGKWFHSDSTSRIQQLGLVMMGQNMPSNLMWKTMDGTFVQMTPELAQQIFQASAASDMTNFAIAEQHRQQMLLSDDPLNYDFRNTAPQWPPIFGE
jgi:hypothetical protein